MDSVGRSTLRCAGPREVIASTTDDELEMMLDAMKIDQDVSDSPVTMTFTIN
jgi:hypothetical protein